MGIGWRQLGSLSDRRFGLTLAIGGVLHDTRLSDTPVGVRCGRCARTGRTGSWIAGFRPIRGGRPGRFESDAHRPRCRSCVTLVHLSPPVAARPNRSCPTRRRRAVAPLGIVPEDVAIPPGAHLHETGTDQVGTPSDVCRQPLLGIVTKPSSSVGLTDGRWSRRTGATSPCGWSSSAGVRAYAASRPPEDGRGSVLANLADLAFQRAQLRPPRHRIKKNRGRRR
jgi:hypothetical protein